MAVANGRQGRNTLTRAVAWGAGAAVAGLLARALVEPLVLAEEWEEARVPNLPEAWEGRRIGLLSDIHNGLVGSNGVVTRRAVRRLVQLRPSAVLLAGDFVHGDHEAVEGAVELFRPLVQANIPLYAVLGNHDYAMPSKSSREDVGLAEELKRSLEELGVRVLENEIVQMRLADSDEPLHLVGIGPHTPRRDRPGEVLGKLDASSPRVVMMHHPVSFDRCPPQSAPFAVAGHTHGGQVRLPFSPLVRYITYIKEIEVIVAGWVDDRMIGGYGGRGNRLYVSRGVGCSVAPLRLFCLPELTLFTLRRGD